MFTLNPEDSIERAVLEDTDDEGLRVIKSSNPRIDRIFGSCYPYLNKGNLSNLATFSIMILGMIMKAVVGSVDHCDSTPASAAQWTAKLLIGCGLFGFAGGITNWLAVKMLFDPVLVC